MSFYSKISMQSKAECDTYEGEITLPNGDTFDHRKTVKMIGFHRLGKFYENDDADAVFWPLGQKREPHFAKKLDTDSKDYEVTGEGENNTLVSWVANIKLRRWFRDSGFALDLNDLSEECAAYGSAVMKVTPKGEEKNLALCNLLYLWFDPSVENIVDSPINELHQLTEYEIRAMKGWKDVDKAIEKAEKITQDDAGKTSLIIQKYKIWERVGEYQIKDENGQPIDKEAKYYHTIFCGYGTDEVILFQEEIAKEDCPYIDFHISKYEDRWLRIGVYERLFGLQGLTNQLVSYNNEANAIASLLLLQSRDKSLIGRNILKEAASGMILDTSGISQVAIDNRFLSGFLAELQSLEAKADELCMTPEVVTGDKLPSSATFRGQALLTNTANDAFKNPRDRIGFKMAEVILNLILPTLMKKWNSEEVIEIANNEEDATMFDYYAERYAVAQFAAQQQAQGIPLSTKDIAMFRQRFADENSIKKRQLDISGIFKNFKYKLRLNPTGENINKEQKNGVYSEALAIIGANPMMANNKLFRQYLEDNGISPVKIPQEQIDQMNQAMNPKIPAPQPKMDKLAGLVNN